MDEKTRKQLGVVGVLIVVFILVSIRSFLQVKAAYAKVQRAKAIRPISAAKSGGITVVAPAIEEEAAEGSTWGQDPFTGKSISIGSGQAMALRLSGIIYNEEDPKNSCAIIDDAVVKAGDTVGSSKIMVKEITDKWVIITDGKTERKLKLW